MSKINSEYLETYGNEFDYISVIPATGTSVKIEFWSGSDFVEDPKSPITEAEKVFVRNTSVRFTPSGGYCWIGD
jgi:predicted Rdx family selenoprotein